MKFVNKQIEELSLASLTIPQFLALAIETAKSLGWVFGDINTTGFVSYTNNGFSSWNAEFRLKITKGLAIIQSESGSDSVTDATENKKNLQSFISKFNFLRKALVHEEVVQQHKKFTTGFSSN